MGINDFEDKKDKNNNINKEEKMVGRKININNIF